MKKKLILTSFLLQQSAACIFAQSSIRTTVNSVLNDNLVPTIIIAIVASFATGVISHLDDLRGKNGKSTVESWIAIGQTAVGVFVVISLIGLVVSKTSTMNYTI